MPVEFASLLRLWWALLAVPIVLLFILRVRLRRKPVATLLFWDQLLKEHPPRAWWRRLRNLLALLFQLAFLALVVGALVDPLWAWQKKEARHVVYVIDNSASMSARDARRSGNPAGKSPRGGGADDRFAQAAGYRGDCHRRRSAPSRPRHHRRCANARGRHRKGARFG